MKGYSCIGLFYPKHAHNIGGVLRAAYCYDARLIVIQGNKFKKSATDTDKAYKNIPVLRGELKKMMPYDCVPVAVEMVKGAQNLLEYKHPERAFYIFGPEDGSLPDEVINYCKDVVYIPTQVCMNLAATANVVLYDRLLKGQFI